MVSSNFTLISQVKTLTKSPAIETSRPRTSKDSNPTRIPTSNPLMARVLSNLPSFETPTSDEANQAKMGQSKAIRMRPTWRRTVAQSLQLRGNLSEAKSIGFQTARSTSRTSILTSMAWWGSSCSWTHRWGWQLLCRAMVRRSLSPRRTRTSAASSKLRMCKAYYVRRRGRCSLTPMSSTRSRLVVTTSRWRTPGRRDSISTARKILPLALKAITLAPNSKSSISSMAYPQKIGKTISKATLRCSPTTPSRQMRWRATTRQTQQLGTTLHPSPSPTLRPQRVATKAHSGLARSTWKRR